MKRSLKRGLLGAIAVGSLIGGLPCAFPQNRPSDGTLIPAGLKEAVRADFPSYRLPEESDLTGGWVVRKPGNSSFLCFGDFNGDGIGDAAVILIGEQAWRFVVFEQDKSGEYRPAFIARPKTKEELGRYWAEEILLIPQQILLRKVGKGETWAPEAGDDPHLGRLKADAIELRAKPKPNADSASLVIWERGKYRQVSYEPLVELPADAP